RLSSVDRLSLRDLVCQPAEKQMINGLTPHAYTEPRIVEHPNLELLTGLLAAARPALFVADREWRQIEINEAPLFLCHCSDLTRIVCRISLPTFLDPL